jgi:hypothetical protein
MMVIGKLKGIIMNDNVFVSCVTVALITLICSVTFYQYSELKSVERNVESAIVKGIDPVAVRCAYSNDRDIVCVAYASTHQQANLTPKLAK